MKSMNFRTFLKLFGKLFMSILPGLMPVINPFSHFMPERHAQPIREDEKYHKRY
ncbi:MAG: hypothetical protein JNM02_09705 [Anaerolineales bacterium]|nr:hypothetical protein [Anaerolineales bacterium]